MHIHFPGWSKTLTWRYHLEAGWPLFLRTHPILENRSSILRISGQRGEAVEVLKLATVQVCGVLLCRLLNVAQKNIYELCVILYPLPPHLSPARPLPCPSHHTLPNHTQGVLTQCVPQALRGAGCSMCYTEGYLPGFLSVILSRFDHLECIRHRIPSI